MKTYSNSVLRQMSFVALAWMLMLADIALAQNEKPRIEPPVAGEREIPISNSPFSIRLGENIANAVVAKVEQIDGEPQLSLKLIDYKEQPVNVVQVVTMQEKTIKRTVQVPGGGTEEKEFTVNVPVTTGIPNPRFIPNETENHARVTTVKAFDLKGKVIEKKEWMQRLANPKVVLLLKTPMDERKPLNPLYVQLLRDDLILLYLEHDHGQMDDD